MKNKINREYATEISGRQRGQVSIKLHDFLKRTEFHKLVCKLIYKPSSNQTFQYRNY